MHIHVLTIFPELFEPFLRTSLIGRAVDSGLMRLEVDDLRTFTDDKHRSVDDEPYGGGGGMVLTAQPWFKALATVGESFTQPPRRILLSPQGRRLDEATVCELAQLDGMILMCGRYEGLDQRVIDDAIDDEISIGDYVLSGGELPAMVLIETVSRQIPGVVGLSDSVEHDSFRHGLLDYPHYTRPRVVHGQAVPDVLLSGDHARIEAWRHSQSLRATLAKRPDLLATADLNEEDLRLLEPIAAELGTSLPAGLQNRG